MTSWLQVSAAVDALDTIILSATEAGVSAKYAKKVLKRLQRQLGSILAPAAPRAEIVQSVPAAESAKQQAADQHPPGVQLHVNGTHKPVTKLAEQPDPSASLTQPAVHNAQSGLHVMQNGSQQHARPEVKPLAPQVSVRQPPALLPVRKAPPPGFVKVAKQPLQQLPSGKPAWPLAKAPVLSTQPVVPPRPVATTHPPVQPNALPARASQPVPQVEFGVICMLALACALGFVHSVNL